jgi:hypothetical protein
LSPRHQREDAVMPHRPKGEVDEWAAMLQVQEKLAQQGASEYEMLKRGKQREYMESIQQQLDEKRRREEQARKDKEREMLRVKEEIARNRQLEQQLRDKNKEEASRVREMFEQQKVEREAMLRQERAAQHQVTVCVCVCVCVCVWVCV